MTNREGFYHAIASDLRRGVARVIYASDTLAILTVADSFYIASDYTVNEDGYVAFLVNSKMIRAMLVDETYLQQMLLTTDQATLKQMMFRLTEKTFEKLCKTLKKDAESGLVHKFVDPELESWIEKTYGKPQVPLTEKPKRRSLFHKK